MLYYDKIDISERIYLAKSNNSKEYMIFHHWFFNHGYKSRNSVCNGCHDLTMLSFDVSNVAIIAVKNVDYRYIIHSISKFDPIDSLKIVIDCGYIYKNIALNFSLFKTAVFTFFLFSTYKMINGMDIYKYFNVNIGKVMKNPEMLKVVPEVVFSYAP